MATEGGPNLITDGLMMLLDAGNTKSYPTTGTSWFDKSGNGYNGTLTNGPTFSSENGGSIVFDGTNDIATTSFNTLTPSTTWTIWVKRTQSVNAYNMMMGMYLPYFAFNSSNQIHFSNRIGATQRSLYATSNLVDNVWYFMSFVSSFSGGNTTMLIYLNGSLISQRTDAGQQPTTTDSTFRLGNWSTAGTEFFKGNISQASIYNRVLSAEEIMQNYNATKSRYNL
jgi:hypothetical protein